MHVKNRAEIIKKREKTKNELDITFIKQNHNNKITIHPITEIIKIFKIIITIIIRISMFGIQYNRLN